MITVYEEMVLAFINDVDHGFNSSLLELDYKNIEKRLVDLYGIDTNIASTVLTTLAEELQPDVLYPERIDQFLLNQTMKLVNIISNLKAERDELREDLAIANVYINDLEGKDNDDA